MDYQTNNTHVDTTRNFSFSQGKKHEVITWRIFFFAKIPDSPCRFVSSCGEENAKYTQKKLKLSLNYPPILENRLLLL